jgi:hypothetical protein
MRGSLIVQATLLVHAVLLLLASTSFTIVTSVFGGAPFSWCYFQYSIRSGFGTPYVSDYSLATVIAYLLAFAAGLVGFSLAYYEGRRIIGLLGVVLSVVGLISFSVEGSHWLFDHHRSWLLFSPALMLVLVLVTRLTRRDGSGQESKPNLA